MRDNMQRISAAAPMPNPGMPRSHLSFWINNVNAKPVSGNLGAMTVSFRMNELLLVAISIGFCETLKPLSLQDCSILT